MRKHVYFTAAVAAVLAFGVIAPTSAQAAPVTIKKTVNKSVSRGGKVTIKPRLEREDDTKILTKTVTVKKGGRVIARNKKSVSVGVGTYRVTTKVKFQVLNWDTETYGPTRVKSKTYTLVVSAKRAKPRGSNHGGTSSRYYKNCAAVRAAGAAPIYRGDPGYASHLDRDGDGVGCE